MSEKNLYIEKARARITQWGAEIDEMTTGADDAEARLAALRNASGAAWQDAKPGFDKARDDISNAFTNAASR